MIILWDALEDKRDIEQACRGAGVSMSEHLRNELGGTNETLETLDQAFGSQTTCDEQTK